MRSIGDLNNLKWNITAKTVKDRDLRQSRTPDNANKDLANITAPELESHINPLMQSEKYDWMMHSVGSVYSEHGMQIKKTRKEVQPSENIILEPYKKVLKQK